MDRVAVILIASAILALSAGAIAASSVEPRAGPAYVVLETSGGLRPAVALVGGSGDVAVAYAAGAPYPALVALSPTGRVEMFDDPNGGSWRVVELSGAGWTYWAVRVGSVLHEPTLGVAYNAAVLVDDRALPAGAGLAWSIVDGLDP